ncbi:hypothetical protein BJY04DRAFT_187956 [Aspergillus karnatakaensis]|uniref:uncharacterized protein n=1 Tax=Aspergillus karnatakaensis TaxID=1810916 RepID=UPI003CCD1AEE
MIILTPREAIVAGQPWSFVCREWKKSEAQEVNWWLTHFASRDGNGGNGYCVLLNPEGPFRHPNSEEATVHVSRDVGLLCGSGYKIWAMRVGENPNNDTDRDPLAESQFVNVSCRSG